MSISKSEIEENQKHRDYMADEDEKCRKFIISENEKQRKWDAKEEEKRRVFTVAENEKERKVRTDNLQH